MNRTHLPILGAALGLVIAAFIVSSTGGRVRNADAPPGPIISESSGALKEIVIQYVAGADAVVPVYRDFLRQLDAEVLVDVVCPDRASFDELRAKIGPTPCTLRARIVHHEMTSWSRDRWVALGNAGSDRVMLLSPHEEKAVENWPARRGDQQLVFDLSKSDEQQAISPRRSDLYFEGGDFLADDARVFVTPAVVRANLQQTADSIDALRAKLHRELGRPIEFLRDAPDHHAGMYMMSAGNNVMLVGDPQLAHSLIKTDDELPELPGGPDWSAQLQPQFDSVADQLASLGYRVVRIPTACGYDGRTYLTYVNVITDHRAGKHIVYLPQFRGADALNLRAVETWKQLGYEVRPVDCTSTYRLFGNLHCLVNVVRRTWIIRAMKWPIILLVIAIVAAAFVAYGASADWAQYSSGLNVIVVSRRLMWPLVAASLISCLILLGLVITSKARAWWLIGLAPVLALFVHRFGPGTPGPGGVIDGPAFLDATDRNAPESGDYVVGILFGDRAYAFPYRALFDRPVVALTDYDKRMLLMWSPFANRATAVALTRDLRARDLELVSSPANSLLIYDRRLGQFICGVTGHLIDGHDVAGFSKPIDTKKTTWGEWKSRHPDSKVMAGDRDESLPAGPILPKYKLRVPPMPDADTPITFVTTDPPAAVREDVAIDHPLNVTVGQTRVLIVRDSSNLTRAFDRHLKEDLFLSFENPRNKKRRDVAMSDVETRSSWTSDGRCVDGELKGQKLREIDSDDHLYWGVMKFWYPNLQLVESGDSKSAS